MLPRIRTFTRSERGAFVALVSISAVCALMLGLVSLAGDQRTIAVANSVPAPGEETPSTLRAITISFDTEPDREAVLEALAVEPPVAGTAQWRGRTLEFVLTEPLPTGGYTVTLDQGRLGRGGEQLREAYSFAFEVREAGIALIQTTAEGQRLVAVRDGGEPVELVAAPRIRDYAISPDGSRIAVVTEPEPERTELVLYDTRTGEASVIASDPTMNLATVSWSFDSNALLVVRRDQLPDGEFGVPRVWLTRISGEFVQRVTDEDVPSTSAAWSPDGQWIAYITPATAELGVLNLSTREALVAGEPRSAIISWSADSRLIAFESTAAADGSGIPVQPVRVRSVDGETDLLLGVEGEVRSQPRFLDAETVMSIRREIGPDAQRTDLLFESTVDGSILRGVQLAPAALDILSWDLDPTGSRVVYAVRSGSSIVTITRELESGGREPVQVEGERPRWLP